MTEKTISRPAGQSGKDLHTLLENRPVTIIGAPFPLAAKEIERQGFPAVYLSGAALSAGLLGIPDIGLIPFETLEQQTLTAKGVAEACMKTGYKFSPRLHIDLFGNAWGT